MLQELYEVYNPTTGSIFTSFALRQEVEKEAVMDRLLALFIACDKVSTPSSIDIVVTNSVKYNLESIKLKAAEAIIDRLPFLHDALGVIDIAAVIYDDSYPHIDCGLRKAVISQIQSRLPTIMEDETAWEAYSSNKTVLKALHECHCASLEDVSSDEALTPPATPNKVEKKYRAQTRSSGA